jgi:hypothetical protein
MSLENAKHIVGEIDGIRCTIVERGISLERAAFLRNLLEFNNYEVKESEEHPENPEEDTAYSIGVTDITFNPVFEIYECLLKTPEGEYVTPGYWLQECTSCDKRYWLGHRERSQEVQDNAAE